MFILNKLFVLLFLISRGLWWRIMASGQLSILREHCTCVGNLKVFFCFPQLRHQVKCRNLHPYLLHYPAALYQPSADGRSPSSQKFHPDVPSRLRPQLRCLLLTVFCIWTQLNGAAGYHGDHFLKNTGKEEGRQWCKVQEHREATGEKDTKQGQVCCFTAIFMTDFMINLRSTCALWYKSSIFYV